VGDVGLEDVVEPSAVPTERAVIEPAVQAGWRDFGFELGIEGLEGEVGLEFVLVAKRVLGGSFPSRSGPLRGRIGHREIAIGSCVIPWVNSHEISQRDLCEQYFVCLCEPELTSFRPCLPSGFPSRSLGKPLAVDRTKSLAVNRSPFPRSRHTSSPPSPVEAYSQGVQSLSILYGRWGRDLLVIS
jgi:hypothetical protein